MLHLFVDDIRTASPPWTNARTVEDAIELIRDATEFVVSLDHDLGGESTTRELVTWMLWNGYTPVAASVHSANPVGVAWLTTALERDFGHPIPELVDLPRWV